MKHTLSILLFFMGVCNVVFSQKAEQGEPLGLDKIVCDILYWDGQAYLIDKTPLSAFDKYATLFPEAALSEISFVYGHPAPGQHYYPIWIVRDSVLYLQEIGFYEDSAYIKKVLPNHERYNRMENLTGRKFKKQTAKSIPPESPVGSIRADWVEGAICIKQSPSDFLKKNSRALEKKYGDQLGNIFYEVWKKEPYLRLTFNGGKLVSTKLVTPQK